MSQNLIIPEFLENETPRENSANAIRYLLQPFFTRPEIFTAVTYNLNFFFLQQDFL